MMNKKGFELSINFIVILIISLVIFVGGLSFTYKFFRLAEKTKTDIDQEQQEKIENLLSDGQKVAMPTAYRTVKINNDDVIGLGIVNSYRRTWTFYVDVFFDTSFDKAGAIIPGVDPDYINLNWIFNDTFAYNLAPSQSKKVPLYMKVASKVAVDKGTVSGTYIFNVCVYEADPVTESYGNDMPKYCPPADAEREHLYDGYVHQMAIEVP
jgi:hypothetical protein